MNRDAIVKKLVEHQMELKTRFDIASLSLFGSAARDESTEKSDIDFLVRFNDPPGLFGFLELKFYLEDLLHCPVDLVTENAIKKQLREPIFREALHAI